MIKVFIGIGYTPDLSEKNAHDLADEWLDRNSEVNEKKREIQNIELESSDSDRWKCLLQITY